MSDSEKAWAELFDPSTSPTRLSEIAGAYPHYGPQILQHPNIYPELSAWIIQTQSSSPATAQTQQFANAGQFASTPADNKANKANKKTRMWWIIGGVGAVLIAAAITLILILGSMFGGSATPEAAAKKSIEAALSLDSLSLAGSLAPSERDPLQESLKAVQQINFSENGLSQEELLSRFSELIDASVSDIKLEAETIDADISRVAIVGGSISITGNSEQIIDFFVEQIEANTDDYSGIDLQEIRNELENYFAESWPLQLKIHEWGVENLASGAQFERQLALMTVKEGGSWYTSPMLSLADLFIHRYYGQGQGMPWSYGTVPKASKAETIADALENFSVGMESLLNLGSSRELAAALPLPERGLNLTIDPGFTVAEENGNRALLLPNNYRVMHDGWRDGWRDGFELDGLCVTREGQVNRYCYDDEIEKNIPELRGLFDWDELGIVAVKEDGNWQLSSLYTLANILDVFADGADEDFEKALKDIGLRLEREREEYYR